MSKVGFIILFVGMTCADSPNVLIPIAIMLFGASLMVLGGANEKTN